MEVIYRPSILVAFSLLIIFTLETKSESIPDQQPRGMYRRCTNSINFSPNNTYNSTLNTLLNRLTSNASANPTGFYSTSVYDISVNYTFNGYFLCRGDLDNVACHSCVSMAVARDGSVCSRNNMETTIYYNRCMIRFSNNTLLGVLALEPEYSEQGPNPIGSNNDDLEQRIGNMFNALAFRVANDQSGRKFATTSVSINALTTLYGSAQCTPDLSVGDCHICLTNAIGNLQLDRSGWNFLVPSCNMRFETYPFFNAAGYSLLSPPPPVITGFSNGRTNISIGLIIGIVAAAAITAAVLPTIGLCLINKKVEKYHAISTMLTKQGEDNMTVESLRYDLAQLQSATDNFSKENKLGVGGFGVVYKGTLLNGQNIAVKRLSTNANQGEEEFKNEVLLVAKLQHRNLVRLLGFCLTEEEKLPIYEFVPNKSLDNFLFDPEKRRQLDWNTRYNIIGGVARGMLYLHEDSRLKVIHRDLKASNVLLDESMSPKVSDFGTARIFGADQTHGTTGRIVGTLGYMAPEYVMHGKFSAKSDVYSFGILVLEIISGEKSCDFCQQDGATNLIAYAWKHWRNGTPLEFVDESIRDQSSMEEVIRCVNLSLLCVQDAEQRPLMSTIVLMLNSFSTIIPLPKEPTLNFPSSTNPGYTRDTNNSIQRSLSDVSITIPR